MISDRKKGKKNLINLSFVIAFHVKIQQKTINLSFCVVFASIKLPQHNIIIQSISDTNFGLKTKVRSIS